VLGRAAQPQLFDGTTQAAAIQTTGSILPERAHVVDAGVVQQLLPQCPTSAGGLSAKAQPANCPSLEVGASVYYKNARDLLDVGQFGQAYALTEFNYDRAENYGVEMFGRFRWGNFTAATSWAWAVQHANNIVSNQTLFNPDDLAYIQTHWIYTEQDQTWTGSGRLSYKWTDTHSLLDGTTAGATVIFGSGLRTDPSDGSICPNCLHLPSYWQVNVGLSHEFAGAGWNGLPVTVRFDVVNVTDNVYQIRNGSGIGVFAAQYGPRRGYYMGISQKLGAPEHGSAPDFYTKAAPAPVYQWAGAYAGASFGGAFSREDASTPIGAAATDPSGVLGGVQFGYNYLFAPHWLAGVEGELGWTSAQSKTNFVDPAGTTAMAVTGDHNWYDTLSGRLGYVTGPLLVYAKGGAAWMNADYRLEVTQNNGFSSADVMSANRAGWNAGAGMEYMLGSHWSAKLEYDHLDFGSSTLGFANPLGNGVTFKTQVNEWKAGVNYHWAPGDLLGTF
jgi:opacity protein-like surface antigen